MQFPEIFFVDEDKSEADAARRLAKHCTDVGISSPLVVASGHGLGLIAQLQGSTVRMRAEGANQQWADELGAKAGSEDLDGIVAVGGGRCLDVGKLAAVRAGVPMVAVPTQLSHDGLCSPVAVVPKTDGCGESLGAIMPRAVVIALPTLRTAPVDSVRAGLGDLLANPLALRDWALAVERGLEEHNEEAWHLATQSFEVIADDLDSDPSELRREPGFLRRLADALVLSGMAMIAAGTSRPASGAEHEISHAIDELFGGRALHGAQVAFGCIISVALYDEDTDAFRGRLRRLGLPQSPGDLGLSPDEVAAVIEAAPQTRPGRFTILEETNLDADGARELVGRIWPDG